MRQRLTQVRTVLDEGEEQSGHLENEFWLSSREFGWAPTGFSLVKVATTPAQLPALEQYLAPTPSVRRYAVGGNLAWLAWPGALAPLHDALLTLNLSGLVLRGAIEHPVIGAPVDPVFTQRVRQALDPAGKFLEL